MSKITLNVKLILKVKNISDMGYQVDIESQKLSWYTIEYWKSKVELIYDGILNVKYHNEYQVDIESQKLSWYTIEYWMSKITMNIHINIEHRQPRGFAPGPPRLRRDRIFHTWHVITQPKPKSENVRCVPQRPTYQSKVTQTHKCVSTPSPLSARLGTPTTRRRVWRAKRTTSSTKSITAFARNGRRGIGATLPRPPHAHLTPDEPKPTEGISINPRENLNR
jgi:hypothetical protein